MELYIEKSFRGRFVKGRTPFNKNKTWDDLGLSNKDKKKILRNLELGRKKGRNYPTHFTRIIMLKKGKIIGRFDGSNDAARKTGIQARNIRGCIEGKRKHAGGWKGKGFQFIDENFLFIFIERLQNI